MSPLVPAPSGARRIALGLSAAIALSVVATLSAQIPGRNINMVSGTEWPGGDPFLQRQNEPSLAASTRNPLHLLAGANDYRTVDVPGLPDGVETGDAWLGLFKSFDGGQRWSSTLLPGYPQDTSDAGMASPLKGYQAAADPVVRAGTSGLLYYNGLVFDRGENGKSGIFVARFVDRNNKENGDPILYMGTSMVAQSTGTAFLDKPWMAVDIPRGGSPGWCAAGELTPGLAASARIKRNGHRNRGRGNGIGNNLPPDDGIQYVPAGAVYVAYSSITGEGTTLKSEIFLKRSMDCGVTWSNPIRVSRTADTINQGATIAIDPVTGHVFVAYRRFATPAQPDADAVMVTRVTVGAGTADTPGMARGFRRYGPANQAIERLFEHRKKRIETNPAAELSDFDQGTTTTSFRTNAYPVMTFDGSGRAYIAWTERGFAAARPDPVDGDARILMTTTTDGRAFTAPIVVDDQPPASQFELFGHQLMPSLTFAGGKLLLVYYDLRETRAQVFGPYVDDVLSTNNRRQTFDIRAALGTPGATPVFAPSTQVSDYLLGARTKTSALEQLQFNPPNLPMFRLGTVPFVGDYIDVAPAPAFVPTANGGWAYNTAATAEFPVFHAAWTDNRDVRPPLDGNWQNYAPPGSAGGPSIFDPAQTAPVCAPGNAGSRNQNIYTSRIGGGLLVGAPGNAKPLSQTIQRGFVVFAQNQTAQTRTFRMRVLAQPAGGRASFAQFPLPPYTASSPAPLTVLDVRVPARSTASRTLWITAPDPRAQVSLDVSEVTAVGGTVVSGGLTGKVVLNPDIENPDIENPDIENPDIENPDIENAEVYNPDIENPDIENPDIENPDIENVVVANPDIENIGVGNPDIENPDIENPDIENPDIENSTLEEVKANGVVSDITWTVSNIGNTTSAFNVNMFLASATLPAGLHTQLIIYKTYKTPVALLCELKTETRNVLIANVPSPVFVSPGQGIPDQNDPSDKNATLWLAPGELGQVTLRVYDTDASNNITVIGPDGQPRSVDPALNPTTQVTPGVAGQGVDILDPDGATRPPVITTTGTNIVFLQQPTTTVPGATIAPPVSVRLYDNAGAPLPGVPVTVSLLSSTLAAPPVGATLGGTTTVVADTNGIATFPGLSVNLAGAYVLRAEATAPGVDAMGHSVVFTVSPHVVAFVQQPSTATVGTTITPAVTVRVSDGAGAVLPGVQVALSLLDGALSPAPVGALTGGTTAVTNAAGVAAFASLTVNQAGTWVLRAQATAPGVTATGDSDAFAITAPPGPASPVSVWEGDGDATDSVGDNNGTLQGGAGFAPGRIGPAFGFSNVPASAVRQYVRVPDHPSLQFTTAMTMAAWIFPTSAGVGGDAIIVNKEGEYEFARFPDGSIGWAFSGPGGAGYGWVTGAPTGSAPINMWTHVAVTYDAGTVVTYVNGLPVSTITGAPAPIGDFYPALNELWIGGRQSFSANPEWFDGRIDQVVVGNTPFTGANIASIYAAGAPGTPATVSITNYASIFDGTPKPVTVVTNPAALAVTTIYDTSLTVPSAIGAYLVQAIVSEPGYTGSSSLVKTIASTTSAGGSGGGPYGPLSCGAGVFANGVRPSTNSYYGLLGTQLLCSDANHPARVAGPLNGGWGHTTYTDTDVTCPAGQVMVGVHGQTGAPFGFRAVENMGPRCQPSTGGAITDVAAAGGGIYPDQAFSLTCPAGQAVTGIVGGQGEVIDSVALVCGTLPPPSPTITSVSPSTGAPGEGFLVVRGTSLPNPSGSVAVVTSGATSANGFIFLSPSTTDGYFVRLPFPFPTGPATIRIENGATVTNSFPITVSSTPGTPVITAVYSSLTGPTPTTEFNPGQTIYVAADGIDTLGAVIRFQQGATIVDVPAGTAYSSASIGLVVEVTAPNLPSISYGPISVSIRQAGSAFSATVAMNVVD